MPGEPQPLDRPERRDLDVLRIEPIIRGWITRGGKQLHPRAQATWGWLARDGYPHEFEFKLADLGRYFFAEHPDSPRQWIARLKDEGLIEQLGAVGGPGGGVRIKLLDPHEVDRLRLRRADPQRTLPGIAVVQEVDSLPFEIAEAAETTQPSGSRRAAAANPPAQPPAALGDRAPITDVGSPSAATCCAGGFTECVAAGDAPLALQESLRRHLGQGTAEVYLSVARWEFGKTSKLFLPATFTRDHVRKNFGPGIVAALRECGLSGPLEFEIDPLLQKKESPSAAGGCAGGSVRFLPSRNSFLPSIHPSAGNDFWNEDEGPEPEVVRRARELYAAIGDPTLFRATAFRAVLLVDDGTLEAAELERLARDRPCDFNTALGELARARRAWRPIGFVKSQLKSSHDVAWRRRWDQAQASRPKPR